MVGDECDVPRRPANYMENQMSTYARGLLLVGALLLLAQPSPGQPTVAISPSTSTVTVTQQFTADVVVNNVTSCRAANVKISFDHNILTYNSAMKGSFMPDAFSPGAMVTVGQQYDVFTFDQAVLGINSYSGSGALVTITFTAKAVGTTQLAIESADLRSPPNVQIAVSSVNGSVTVTPPLPITLVAFLISMTEENFPLLTWKTLSEVDNYGFIVQRKGGASTDEFADLPGGFLAGQGTTTEVHEYSYVDKSAGPGLWYYRLKQIDGNRNTHFSDAVSLSVVTSVEGQANPAGFVLEQNYPNPFNPFYHY